MIGSSRRARGLRLAAATVAAACTGTACSGRPLADIQPTTAVATSSSTGATTSDGSITTVDPVTGRPVKANADTAEVDFAGFLSPGDLAVPPDLEKIAAVDLAKELNTFRDVFFLHDPTPKPFDPNDCYDNLFDTQAFTAGKALLVYELKSEDFAECLNSGAQQDPNLKLEFTKATIHYFDKSTCSGVDLTPLNGKHQKDLTDADKRVCDEATSADQLRNSAIEYEFKLTETSVGSSMTVRSRSLVSMMTAQGTSCHGVRNGSVWTFGPCEHTVTTSYQILSEQGDMSELKKVYQSRYLKAVGASLKGSNGKAFYDAGRMSVAFNGWQGELVYAGGDVKPQWSLSDGKAPQSGYFSPE